MHVKHEVWLLQLAQPSGHGVHAPEAALAYVPLGQVVTHEPSAAWYVPLGHVVQSALLPPSHVLQVA